MNFGLTYARHKAVTVFNRIDHLARAITEQAAAKLFQEDADNLLLESVTLEDLDTTLFYGIDAGQDFMMEAITTQKARVNKTMQAFSRSLNQALTGTGITADKEVEVSKPRKSGAIAVMTGKVNLSDGQSVSVVFHAPDNDPLVINPDDTLIAFRFLLNARDITHAVAPNGGSDISLKQVTMVISNLVEKNSDKFQAKQSENQALKQEIEQAAEKSEHLESEMAMTSDLITQAEAEIKQATSNADKLQARIDKQNALQEKLQADIDSWEAKKVVASSGDGQAQQPTAEPKTGEPGEYSLSPEQRKNALDRIWNKKSADFRSGRGKNRSIMVNGMILDQRSAGTTVVPLDALSDTEIARILDTTVGELSGAVAGYDFKQAAPVPAGNEVEAALNAAIEDGGRPTTDKLIRNLPESEFKTAIQSAITTYRGKTGRLFMPRAVDFAPSVQLLMDHNVTDQETLLSSIKDFDRFGFLPDDSRQAREAATMATDKLRTLGDKVDQARRSKKPEKVENAINAIIEEMPKFQLPDATQERSVANLLNKAKEAKSGSLTEAVEFLQYASAYHGLTPIGYGDMKTSPAAPGEAQEVDPTQEQPAQSQAPQEPAQEPEPTPEPAPEPEKTQSDDPHDNHPHKDVPEVAQRIAEFRANKGRVFKKGERAISKGLARYTITDVDSPLTATLRDEDGHSFAFSPEDLDFMQIHVEGINEPDAPLDELVELLADIGTPLNQFIDEKGKMSFDGQDAIVDHLRTKGMNIKYAVKQAQRLRFAQNKGEIDLRDAGPKGLPTKDLKSIVDALNNGDINLKVARERVDGLMMAQPNTVQKPLRAASQAKRKNSFLEYMDEAIKLKEAYNPNAPRVNLGGLNTYDFNTETYNVIDEIGMFGKSWDQVGQVRPDKLFQLIEEQNLDARVLDAAKDYYGDKSGSEPEPEPAPTQEPVQPAATELTKLQSSVNNVKKRFERGELSVRNAKYWFEPGGLGLSIEKTPEVEAAINKALAAKRKTAFLDALDEAVAIEQSQLAAKQEPAPQVDFLEEHRATFDQAIAMGANITIDGKKVLFDNDGNQFEAELTDEAHIEDLAGAVQDWIEGADERKREADIEKLSAFVKGARLPKGWSLDKDQLDDEFGPSIGIDTPLTKEFDITNFLLAVDKADDSKINLIYSEGTTLKQDVNSMNEVKEAIVESGFVGNDPEINAVVEEYLSGDLEVSPEAESMIKEIVERLGTAGGADDQVKANGVEDAVATLKELVASNELTSDEYLAKMETAFNVIQAADQLDEYEPLMNEAADKLTSIMDAEEQGAA